MRQKVLYLILALFLIGSLASSCKREEGYQEPLNNPSEKQSVKENQKNENDVDRSEIVQAKDLDESDLNKEEVKAVEKGSDFNDSAQDNLDLSEVLAKGANIEEIHEIVRVYPSGKVLDLTGVEKSIWETLFYAEEIAQDVKNRIVGKSYGENCDVPFEDLRYIRVLYQGFDELTHIGEMIVNTKIAEDVVSIFKELFEQGYPIEKMVLVDEYDADDNASMADNNSSAFNYRNIDGSDNLSLHSYGLAIDINPKYNPYVKERNGKTVVLPENGLEYTDRNKDCPYYIKKGDICYEAFIKRGFTWGGDWKKTKDYQHFEMKKEDK